MTITKTFIVSILVLLSTYGIKGLKLEKVLILSRHNIRAPLVGELDDFTPKKWPEWSEKPAHLTAKGELMESYIGEYFSDWFKQHGLITDCPNPKTTIVHANAPQRTIQTAKMFAEYAFPNCNIKVRFKTGVKMDPIFNMVIKNGSEEFEELAVTSMNSKIDAYNLTKQYDMLDNILDLKNSKACKQDSFCDFTEEVTGAVAKVNEEPNVEGPLLIANKIVDTFLMQYYNGTDFKRIAWGAITEADLAYLTKIAEANIAVRFKTKIVARNVAIPLLQYLAEILLSDDTDLAVLVGHDSNLISVISALDFKPYNLTDQYEIAPIGGKIVFQKWYDEEQDEDLLKIEYIYPSKDQLRNGTRISWKQPPQITILEMEGCEINKNGFCSWHHFEFIMEKYLHKHKKTNDQ